MRIGIIGTGNIGGMLTTAFALNSRLDVYIYNRTRAKAESLVSGTHNVFLADTATDAVRDSDIVFICTKASEGRRIIEDIGPKLTRQQILVTTISSISTADVEQLTPSSVAKVLPSMTQLTRSGVLLVTYGLSVTPTHREKLHDLLSDISTPFPVDECQVRVASDLSSCGPAFMSYLFSQWAETAGATGQLTTVQAEQLLSETVIGLATLLQAGYTFSDIISRIAVPGGVTEAGMQSLKQDGPGVFINLHRATSRFANDAAIASTRTH